VGVAFIKFKFILSVLLLLTVFFTVQLTLDTVSAATTNQSTIVNTVVKNNTTQTSVNSQSKTLVASTPVKSSSTVYISMSQLKVASITVKNYIYTHRKLPTNVTIAKNQVTMPQFLELLTTGVIKIRYGSTSSMPLRTAYSTTNIYETVKSGTINKDEYLNIAKWVKIFIDKNHKVPSLVKTSQGKVNYNTLIFTYSRIISFAATQKRLPNTANINSWMSVISAKPVYITSDHIIRDEVDNARINAIVKGLNALGLYAVNWGLGPDKHYDILTSVKVPQNALVINIYGGACASTLYEMGTKYYKSIKGTREVFSIFWNTSINITGLDFLRRAPDDNFSPVGFLPDTKDVDGDTKIEVGLPGREDGLAHPDDYLHANGYNYFYSSDINTVVSAIYKQAVF
jgi:hypothetical protein